MWVRLLKSYTNKRGKKFHIGKLLNVDRRTYKEITENGIAVDYSGQVPPKAKTKTEFFKPKIQWH